MNKIILTSYAEFPNDKDNCSIGIMSTNNDYGNQIFLCRLQIEDKDGNQRAVRFDFGLDYPTSFWIPTPLFDLSFALEAKLVYGRNKYLGNMMVWRAPRDMGPAAYQKARLAVRHG